ncbi:hypothetical protein [Bacillus thuringiensis]|uniref:hypothetical protein n=1 Tax=Bacillus cereus group TaxID=86661 RepID=UPI000BF82E34|nr:hypothetical protein [Bacillus thuringiensis]PGA28364.1 hypothetical protein COL80_08790 [Bacillus thuringiensis]
MEEKNNDLCEANLESKEIRTGIINYPSGPRKIQYSVVDGLVIFEGDAILDTLEEMKSQGIAIRFNGSLARRNYSLRN